MTVFSGQLHKMFTQDTQPVSYQLELAGEKIALNDLIGKTLKFSFHGAINCSHCGRKTKKSYSQGFCYPCFKALAQCDLCIMSPEKCHYHLGTCRDPEWGEQFCFRDHIVYLANSSGLKVGITRETQVPTRWMDQGALTALPIFRVKTRLQSGLVEDAIRQHTSDRTNWRNMLKGISPDINLLDERDRLLELAKDDIAQLQQQFGLDAIYPLLDARPYQFTYPVEQHPEKVVAHNLDKTPEVEGILKGIKGQYLILDSGVLNIRKFSAYHVDLQIQGC